MFQTILIANRGEIACRIMHTAQAMGVKCVAVYSDADIDAPHVKLADTAVHIGPAAPSESYLQTDKILEAAKSTGADAIHPGYGFLSENADFADACEAEGIVFIGPNADTIRVMGSKSAAKDLMEEAGVPTLPGYQGDDQDVATFKAEAKRIGYPVLLKATAGGGGKGMRLVEKASELEDALASAKREALSAFGDDKFLVEKYLGRPRHVEVQVFGDVYGDVVHLFERDCSVQRRHQKVIEEAPAPDLPDYVREKLLTAGVNAAKAVNYIGAGTVEFLYDGEDGVYFMEMNTRLQVEHPVSEEVTGIDLVEWQLRIASDERLPLTQDEIFVDGHAIEARLYAEDPTRDFAPSVGELSTLHLPDDIARVDAGVVEGGEVTPNYDPMIAKIITHGATRDEAVRVMARAMEDTRVAGLDTNATLLHRLMVCEDFADANLSTKLIEENTDELLSASEPDEAVLAALGLFLSANAPGWRLNAPREDTHWITWQDNTARLTVQSCDDALSIELAPNDTAAARRAKEAPDTPLKVEAEVLSNTNGHIRFVQDGQIVSAHVAIQKAGWRIWIGAESYDVQVADPLAGEAGNAAGGGGLSAPMPGVITQLLVDEGDKVEAGQALLIMEAMKMEHTISAPADGIVSGFRFASGDQVGDGDLLVDFETDA